MAQWGKNDAASNSVLWAPTSVKLAPNTTNRDALFGNTTANAFIAGVTVGQYGVDANEVAAGGGKVSHTGWVLQTTGSGGRAGRVFTEVLVAGGITGDAEDTSFPDYVLRITTQPTNKTANSTNNDIATFTGAAATRPTGGTVGYKWQYYNGAIFLDLSDAGAYSNTSTATLSVLANTASNGEIFRLSATNPGATTVYSSNAVLTITT